MGFRMIFERKNWLIYSFHILFVLLTPFLFALVLGCNRIKAEKVDYGPEVSDDDVNNALVKAVSGRTFNNIAVGQYVDYDINRRLENEETVMTLGRLHSKVIDKKEDADTVTFTLQVTRSTRMDSDAFETVVTEEPLILEKAKDITFAQVVRSQYSAQSLRAQSLAEKADGPKKTRVTYHRLQEFTKVVDAHNYIKPRNDCGGLTNCQLTIRYVFFDLVQWYENGQSQKVSLNFGFSPDSPFLPFGDDFDQMNGLLVTDCRSAYIPVTGRTVYVRDCQNIQDLQK
jgi:hypothetical protein